MTEEQAPHGFTVDPAGASKLILISDGKMKTITLPDYGEVTVKTVNGKIQKFDVRQGELF